MKILFGLATTQLILSLCVASAVAMTPPPSDEVYTQAPANIIPTEPMDVIEVPSREPTPPTELVVASLTSPWQVENFVSDRGFAVNECIMRAEYSNDIEITFKGKKGQLSALRVRDLNGVDDTVVKGMLALGLGDNSYGLQSRSVDGQIDASLLTVPAPAEKLKDIPTYRLRLGARDIVMSTEGFAIAYQDLLACQGYDNVASLKVVNEPLDDVVLRDLPAPINVSKMPAEPVDLVVEDERGVEVEETPSETPLRDSGDNIPLAMALPMIVPNDFTFKLDGKIDPMRPISWSMNDGDVWIDTLEEALTPLGYDVEVGEGDIVISTSVKDGVPSHRPAETSIANIEKTWTGVKGEKLSTVLTRWAMEAGVKPEIDLTQDVKLSKDFKGLGQLDVAVNQLLHETLGEGNVNAVLDNGQGNIQPITVAETRKSKPVPVDNPYRWRALQGTSLRKVLQRWSAKEHVDFIWQADQQFLVKQTMKNTTDYNHAVAALLAQYDAQDIKPVASLNIDPETRKKTLIVTVN